MNCLECKNYWSSDIDELMCHWCPYLEAKKEKKENDEIK